MGSQDGRFEPEDRERIHRDYVAWWNHELERPLVQVLGSEYPPRPVYLPPEEHFHSNYPLEMPADDVIAQVTPHLEARRYYGDAYPRWWLNFGPGIVAGFMGAKVRSVPETVWFEPPDDHPASAIRLRYDPENTWWLRVKALTRAAVEIWEGRVQVSHTDLGGNLDIIASFRTTEGLLTDLYDAPEEVECLVGGVTRAWLRYYDALDAIIRPACPGTTPWAPIWSPDTCYMLQCDFAYMISPAMFDRFVLPDLTACCDRLEHGFYHLDGRGQIPHLEMLLAMPRMRGIQWVPGDGSPPPQDWPDLLERIVRAGKLCQLYVSAEGALQIVRRHGGKGFMLTVQDEMTADEASAFLQALTREDAGRR